MMTLAAGASVGAAALNACNGPSSSGAPVVAPGVVNLSVSITGDGEVKDSTKAIECENPAVGPTYCSAPFKAGTTVHLTASPIGTNKFIGWQANGVTVGTDLSIDVQLDLDGGATQITAVFGFPELLDAGPDGSSTVPPAPDGGTPDGGTPDAGQDAGGPKVAMLTDSMNRFAPISLTGFTCGLVSSYGFVAQKDLPPEFAAAAPASAGSGTWHLFLSSEGPQIQLVHPPLTDIEWEVFKTLTLSQAGEDVGTLTMNPLGSATGTMTLSGWVGCQ